MMKWGFAINAGFDGDEVVATATMPLTISLEPRTQ